MDQTTLVMLLIGGAYNLKSLQESSLVQKIIILLCG